jgi:hypothetical protein
LFLEIIVKNIDVLVKNRESVTSMDAIFVFTIDKYKDALKIVRLKSKNRPHLPCLYNGFILIFFHKDF